MVTKYKSKLAGEVGQYETQLRAGTALAIDPSSGSAGSLPGFALFKAGQLVDAGTIQIPRTGHIGNRLFKLREALVTEFEKPDILIVELIAPVMPSKNGNFLHKSAAALIKSVGAILSAWDVPILEVSPTTWHSMTPPDYVKGDCLDAQMIGWAAFVVLARVLGEPEPEVRLLHEVKKHE